MKAVKVATNLWTPGPRLSSTALYAVTLFMVMMVSGCLDSANNRPVGTKDIYVNSLNAPKAAGVETPTDKTSGKSVQDLAAVVFAQRERPAKEDLIVELLLEQNGKSQLPPLKMEDIRFLQEKYLEWSKNPAPGGPDVGGAVLDSTGATSPAGPAEEVTQGQLRKTGCLRPVDEFRLVQLNLRHYTKRHRQKVSDCYFHNSRVLEHALNRLLQEKETTLSFEGGGQGVVKTYGELEALLKTAGISVGVNYHIYLAPFYKVYRLAADGQTESEIPMPVWFDAGFVLPNGKAAIVPATHSEVLFEMRSPEYGLAAMKLYYSDRGFVFDDEELEVPAWAGSRSLYEFNQAEIPALFAHAVRLRQAFAIFRQAGPPGLKAEGFGLLGVCNDGAGLLMRAARGETFDLPFPLLRTDLVEMPVEFPGSDVWRALRTDTDPAQIALSNADKIRVLGPRLLKSYPFPAGKPSEFFGEYEAFISDLREQLEKSENDREPQSLRAARKYVPAASPPRRPSADTTIRAGQGTAQTTANAARRAPSGPRLSLDFESYAFVTSFDDVQNSAFALKLSGQAEADAYRASLGLRVSNESNQKFLGNIHELYYGDPRTFAVGRFASRASLLGPLGVHDRLNHKVCASPFDCERGGPIGVTAGAGNVRATLALVSLPNLEPRPSFDDSGAMTTRNRYAVPRVEAVDIGGQEFDLRVASQFADGSRLFFKPGVRLEGDWVRARGWELSSYHAYEMSKFASTQATTGLEFAENTDGTLDVVAAANARLSFPYELINSMQFGYAREDDVGFQTEVSHSLRTARHMGSAFSALTYRTANLSLAVGGGAIFEKRTDPLVKFKALGAFGRLKWGGEAYLLFGKNRSAVYLSPLLKYAVTSKFSVWSQADLIQADDQAPVFSGMRANDRVRVGVTYVQN